MIIKIQESVKIEKEVNVEFPIYRKHWLDNSTIFMKVESEEKEICIHVYDDEQKIELEIETPSFWGTEDYLLGKGEHKSSKEEFEKAIISLKKLSNSIG
jgi:hypothetical protein